MALNEMREGNNISVKLKDNEFALVRDKKLCNPNIIKAAVASQHI